jgi:hypothetical protein
LPSWLQKAWLRARRRDPRASWGAYGGFNVSWMILADMEEWLTAQGRNEGNPCWYLLHHGVAQAGGLDCFLSEPGGPLEVARKHAAALSAKAGCVGVALPFGDWDHTVTRVVLLPAAGQLPRKLRQPVRKEAR